MMRNRGFTLIELMIVVMIIGLLAAIGIPNFVRLANNAKEASVKENSHTVQLAAEDFAVLAEGVYPASLADALPSTGQTLVDMLPHATNLPNPFTKALTEPIDGVAATPGETGYVPEVDGTGTVIGYTITGFGKASVVTTLTSGQ